MKKIYLSPEAEVAWVTIEKSILSNGESLNLKDYDDVEDFWD